MVLISKGIGYHQRVGLMEVVWKVVEVIFNFRITASIYYHNYLHGFREGRRTGTATLKAKLLQKLAAMREEVLYVIFLKLNKTYDALDIDIYLKILEGYSMGPQSCGIL